MPMNAVNSSNVSEAAIWHTTSSPCQDAWHALYDICNAAYFHAQQIMPIGCDVPGMTGTEGEVWARHHDLPVCITPTDARYWVDQYALTHN